MLGWWSSHERRSSESKPGASPLRLPALIQHRIDVAAHGLLQPSNGPAIDFSQPCGEEALIAYDSVSWRVFKNPVALFVGGVAAVILELAEPRVRSGVWDHSSFRTEPVKRLQRTGLAAMITVYGARSVAEAMIGNVVRLHERISGQTPDGTAYRANDIDLLNWVQATASFGFVEAYRRYVYPLSVEEVDRFYAEAVPGARLYGARNAPTSDAERHVLFEAMRPRLEASPVVLEFLEIMRQAPAFPRPLRPLQRMLIRAAVNVTPGWARDLLGLTAKHGLRAWERPLVQRAGSLSDRLLLPSSPAVQSCLRLKLPGDYLYRK
jgi:uncharacterized protein (DUF2236 family)